jgi:hypothetical protein
MEVARPAGHVTRTAGPGHGLTHISQMGTEKSGNFGDIAPIFGAWSCILRLHKHLEQTIEQDGSA